MIMYVYSISRQKAEVLNKPSDVRANRQLAGATKVEALQIHANVNSQRAPRTILCSERYFKDRTSPPMFFRETAANDLRKRESFSSQGESPSETG